jgi:hypothetical protein
MEFVTGKIEKAKKTVLYGVEGIGKSTFASRFPAPVFIDTEGSTDAMDVIRTKRPSSWTMLLEQVKYFKTNPAEAGTLVIDTADWAEMLCIDHVCAVKKWDSIESLDYGKGYIYLYEEWGRFLNLLNDVIEAGVNVVLTAHAALRKIDQPDETGSYDHWEMKLQKKTAAMTKEWADMLLFANYKILVVKDKESDRKGKARGGKRVMYTQHHPCWDAKNRYDLPDEADFDFDAISHLVKDMTGPVKSAAVPSPPTAAEAPKPAPESPKDTPAAAPVSEDGDPLPSPPEAEAAKEEASERPKEAPPPWTPPASAPPHLAKLYDLMEKNFVKPEMIMAAVGSRGYFPADMPIDDYPKDFVEGVLVGAWSKVFKIICELNGEPTPF